ncbi:MAG: DUF1295 domain-containing protein [Steroidobacteraceae bacterium]
MLEWQAALLALLPMLLIAVAGWLWSLPHKDVSNVDALWSWFFVAAALCYAWRVELRQPLNGRAQLVLVLLGVWALRLSIHLYLRNHGQPEDRRYRDIRARNEPGFAVRSLYLVFALQVALAWVIVMPVLASLSGHGALGIWDALGLLLWLGGFGFELIGDDQLRRFRADPASQGQVLDSGLWRYTRHPNYFGEATLWWGFYLFAVGAGAAWTLFGPLLLTWMLLKVSGVALLEGDIAERRPAYRRYSERTSAFIPRRPRP